MTDEYVHLPYQMIASIERNLGALVEAQQKSEQEIAAVAQFAVIDRELIKEVESNGYRLLSQRDQALSQSTTFFGSGVPDPYADS